MHGPRADSLPAAPEPERKRKIVDYVLQTRRQILKLLVLVRWSSEAENVAKCMVRLAWIRGPWGELPS